MKFIAKYYSRSDVWLLFLLCAFPLHVWTLLLAFRDISWVAARTNFQDAIGVLSYGMVFAFLESLVFFVIIFFLGFLISPRWTSQYRVVTMGLSAIVLSIWAIIGQLYFLQGWSLPDGFIGFLVRSGHPARYFYPILSFLILITFLIPVWVVLKSQKGYSIARDIADRLSLLGALYLVVDVLALGVVLIRNI